MDGAGSQKPALSREGLFHSGQHCPSELASENLGSGCWGSEEGFLGEGGGGSMSFPLHPSWVEQGEVFVQRLECAGWTDALFKQGGHLSRRQLTEGTPEQPKSRDLAKGWA